MRIPTYEISNDNRSRSAPQHSPDHAIGPPSMRNQARHGRTPRPDGQTGPDFRWFAPGNSWLRIPEMVRDNNQSDNGLTTSTCLENKTTVLFKNRRDESGTNSKSLFSRFSRTRKRYHCLSLPVSRKDSGMSRRRRASAAAYRNGDAERIVVVVLRYRRKQPGHLGLDGVGIAVCGSCQNFYDAIPDNWPRALGQTFAQNDGKFLVVVRS